MGLLFVGSVMQATIEPTRPHFWTRSAVLSLLLAVQTSLGAAQWGRDLLRQKPEWYSSMEARAAAESVLLYQSEFGAWPKNTDLLQPVTPAELDKLNKSGEANTIDNDATTLPLRFLARVHQGAPREKYRQAFVRGVQYLLASQYPNGGFPQFFPLRGDKYYSRITYNDGAMIRALELLRDVAHGQAPFDLTDDDLRAKALAAVQRGIDCILKTQVRQNGKLTAWCAQHDEHTLEPAWARSYEPPSLSGSESVGIVRFLMSVEQPAPEIIVAVKGAVAWFDRVAMKGVRLENVPRQEGRPDRRLVPDSAAPPLWARFYELGTNRPLYLDRDSVFRYHFADIGYERRSGYAYHGTLPAALLEIEYPAWRRKHGLP